MTTQDVVLVSSYDYRLVGLSVLIAVLASHAALDLARRVTSEQGKARLFWLIGGATAMGFGIWSMHYIGMLAFRLPVPVQYDWRIVLLSLLAAILASALALFVVSRRTMGWVRAAPASVVMGGGIATMHYTGMAAMRLPAMCHWSVPFVSLSVVLAIVISLVALGLTFHLREDTRLLSWRKATSALVMGAAIPVMHYTGMAAATFTPAPMPLHELSHAVSVSSLTVVGISMVTFIVLGLVLLTSLGVDSFADTRLLTIRYFGSLAVIGLLAVVSTLLVQYHGHESEGDTRLVNIAGRQRMLSQAISKDVLLLTRARGNAERQNLIADLSSLEAAWGQVHFALQKGDPSLRLSGKTSPEVRQMFAALEPHYAAMAGAVRELLATVKSDQTSLDRSAEVATIVAEEGAYLQTMDAIVFQYDHEATLQHERNSQLHFALLLSILGALLAQGLVVLRPALARIQSGITELVETKQALAAREEALRQEREVLDRVLHISPDHIYFKDRQSRFVRINLALAKWFGLKDPAEAVGKLDSDFFTSGHADQTLADEQAMMRSGQSVSGKEEKETWPDGRVTWVMTTKTLQFDQLGDVVGIMGVSRDITDRKLFEIELARKAEELARSNAELEQFAYVASHDLQEPLRMVASYTQLLARRYKGKLDADADEFIDFAVDGANRMQHLIQDLLSYSRVTTKGKALCLTQAEAACNSAVTNLLQSIQEANASVRVAPLPAVLADATQLTQLFQNLIGNAIKYRDERKPEIQVSASPNGAEWVFSVQDNGIGIEPQYFERIFQMFQRLHTRKEYSGTGIGLAVCRKIVERHKGRIWVESQTGQGSRFLFTIPQAEGIAK